MITIRELIRNISPGQSALHLKYVLDVMDKYYMRIKPHIRTKLVKQELEGTTIYFNVPSESRKSVNYDVIIWFNSKTKINSNTEIKVFSNSPNFAYNFTYLFNQHDSLLFKNLYPPSFLSIPPKMRNPSEAKGFDKHVFAAIKHTFKINLKSESDKFSGTPEPTVRTLTQIQAEIKKSNPVVSDVKTV